MKFFFKRGYGAHGFLFFLENPAYCWDLFVQRMSCYIQHRDVHPEPPTELDLETLYAAPNGNGVDQADKKRWQKHAPNIEHMDNGNAIIIFENSHSGSIHDTLIQARAQIESRWRRLPFYLAAEAHNNPTDDNLALECMKVILQDVFKALVHEWDNFLDISNTHISILENKIYEEPADESRAPELWTNSNQWLKIERLMFVHADLVKELRLRLDDLTDDIATEANWLEAESSNFDRLNNSVQEDLVKPTANLADLMYKSVGIRDSRQSIQLSTSMWRLSWITFIFLPLTFIAGFFGMNVDTFVRQPSIKWYFIIAVPFMLCVIVLWYVLKHVLARQRQSQYRRGIYEEFFHDLAVEHPQVWSRVGPRDYVVPQGRVARFQWWLIKRWSTPEKTIRAANLAAESGARDDLDSWSRCKRYLIRKWTAQLKLAPKTADSAGFLEDGRSDIDDDAVDLPAGLENATQLMNYPVTPTLENMPGGMLTIPVTRNERRPGSPDLRPASAVSRLSAISIAGKVSDRRASSRGSNSSDGRNSSVMIEEEDPSWLTELASQGQKLAQRLPGEVRRSLDLERVRDRSGSPGSAFGSTGSVTRGSSRDANRGETTKEADETAVAAVEDAEGKNQEANS